MSPYLQSDREPIWAADGIEWQMAPGRPCAEGYSDHWFPNHAVPEASAAKLCAGCPVIQQCGTFAIDNRQTDGIWGGMTPQARQAIRKPSKRAPQDGTATHCQRGHPFDADNTYRDVRGRRACRTCRNASKVAHRLRVKAAKDAAA